MTIPRTQQQRFVKNRRKFFAFAPEACRQTEDEENLWSRPQM
jgi:hypothetical protein